MKFAGFGGILKEFILYSSEFEYLTPMSYTGIGVEGCIFNPNVLYWYRSRRLYI